MSDAVKKPSMSLCRVELVGEPGNYTSVAINGRKVWVREDEGVKIDLSNDRLATVRLTLIVDDLIIRPEHPDC